MTDKLIQTPLSVYGSGFTGQSEQKLIECVVSGLGATLFHGDIVIYEQATGLLAAGGAQLNVVNTATPKSPLVVGVISITGDPTTSSASVAPGGLVQVCIGGVARMNIGAQACAAGSLMQTSAVTRQALGNAAPAAADIGTIIGVALEAAAAKDANNTIRCFIRPA